MIKDVSDLEVYKLSLILLPELYALTARLPKSEYDLVLQLRRAGKSIPANIAEGFAKRSSEKEFKRYLKIALGSSDEVISHLRTVIIVSSLSSSKTKMLADQYKQLSRRINTLHLKWQSGGTFQVI